VTRKPAANGMHDLVNLLPGSSLDPVSFQSLQPEKADDLYNRVYNISIEVIIACSDN
jgi:hypothetical protein